MRNKPYFLALNRIPFIGPRTVLKLLTHWPFLGDLFKQSAQQLEEFGLSKSIAQAIGQFNWSEIESDLRWEEENNHFLLTWEDKNYPTLLKEIHDPPPVLYAIGDLACLQQPTIAIVGSRKPSITGRETARQFACELASGAITIVSGLALGIDAQAHQGALEAKGKTVAVMGTGIDIIYPRAHQSLADNICQNGLLLSEFSLRTSPIAGHFPRRNRIISGLSLSTLVVEAAIRSGSLITARFALEQNRDVLAIPGSIFNPQARGCHHLLQQGAKLVTSSADILDELGLHDNKSIEKSKAELALAIDNKNLVKCIGFEITSINQIINRSGLSVEEVTCGLAALELQGVIEMVSGGYVRCYNER